MANALNGLKNFLNLINDNWTLIIVVIGLGIGLYKKIKDYISKSNDEKVKLAWDIISKTMLKRVSEAEKEYLNWKKVGSVKRQEVIDKIFKDYPILNTVTDRNEVIGIIDKMIDEALKEMRTIFEQNNKLLNNEQE